MPSTAFIDSMLASLVISLSGSQATESDPVLWSGRLLAPAAPASLSRGARGLTLVAAGARRDLPGFVATNFGTAACARGDDAMLAIAGTRSDEPWVLFVTQADVGSFEVTDEVILPAVTASRPTVWMQSGECAFGIVLADGSVALVSPGKLQVFADIVPGLRDLTESPRGTLSVSNGRDVLVVAALDELVAIDPRSGAVERTKLTSALTSGAVAVRDDDLVFALDVQGGLVAYRPFAMAPTRLADGESPGAGGLSVLSDASGRDVALVWGTHDGRVLAFDGKTLRELARFNAPITQPLLSMDVLDLGAPQILAALDDGEVGLVILDAEGGAVAERFSLDTRASLPPIVRVGSDQHPAELVLGNGMTSRAFSLGQVTAAGPMRDGMTACAGERLTGEVSGAQQTGLRVVFGPTPQDGAAAHAVDAVVAISVVNPDPHGASPGAPDRLQPNQAPHNHAAAVPASSGGTGLCSATAGASADPYAHPWLVGLALGFCFRRSKRRVPA